MVVLLEDARQEVGGDLDGGLADLPVELARSCRRRGCAGPACRASGGSPSTRPRPRRPRRRRRRRGVARESGSTESCIGPRRLYSSRPRRRGASGPRVDRAEILDRPEGQRTRGSPGASTRRDRGGRSGSRSRGSRWRCRSRARSCGRPGSLAVTRAPMPSRLSTRALPRGGPAGSARRLAACRGRAPRAPGRSARRGRARRRRWRRRRRPRGRSSRGRARRGKRAPRRAASPGGGAAAVPEIAVALDPVDPGALAVEGLRSGDVVVPVGQRLPPELELHVAVAAVAPHPVGRVEVGPGVVVEVGGDGAPVPAGVLRARSARSRPRTCGRRAGAGASCPTPSPRTSGWRSGERGGPRRSRAPRGTRAGSTTACRCRSRRGRAGRRRRSPPTRRTSRTRAPACRSSSRRPRTARPSLRYRFFRPKSLVTRRSARPSWS